MKCPMSQIWFDLLRPWDVSEGKHSAISILTFSKSLCLRDCRAEDSRTWLKDTFIVGTLSHFHRFSKFSSYLHPRVILLLLIRQRLHPRLVSSKCFSISRCPKFGWTFCGHGTSLKANKHSTISILTFSKSLCLRDCSAEDSKTWLKDTFIVGTLSHFHRFSYPQLLPRNPGTQV